MYVYTQAYFLKLGTKKVHFINLLTVLSYKPKNSLVSPRGLFKIDLTAELLGTLRRIH